MKTVAHHQTADAQPVPELQQCYHSLLSNVTEQGITCFAAKNLQYILDSY